MKILTCDAAGSLLWKLQQMERVNGESDGKMWALLLSWLCLLDMGPAK